MVDENKQPDIVDTGVGRWADYKFDYTVTTPPLSREEFHKEIEGITPAVIGEWEDYFNFSEVTGWTKKSWVPFWLWKLVAEPSNWAGKVNG